MSVEELKYRLRTVGDAGYVDLAARTEATHNPVSDLLNQYGVLGFLLYYGAFISLVIYSGSV